MRRENKAAPMLGAVVAAVVWAVLTGAAHAGGLYDGTYWKNLPNPASRMVAVRGFFEGLTWGGCQNIPSYQGPNGKLPPVKQAVDGLDKFYSDPANDHIPVALALTIVAMEIRGEPREAVEKLTRLLRGAVYDLSPR